MHSGVACERLFEKFGLEDVTNQNRPASDISRFKKVYRSFDFVTVGSDAMADVFKKSFGIRDGQLLKTGVPLTDVYYEEHKPELKHKWPKNHPVRTDIQGL